MNKLFRGSSRYFATIFFCLVLMNMIVSASTMGNLWIPSVFNSNMILQRNAEIPVWGKGVSGNTVTVTFAGQSVSTTVVEGKWNLKLQAVEDKGPYVMGIQSGGDKISLSNILVGEVWLCSGQSNMAFTVSGVKNASAEIASAKYPEIRVFGQADGLADTPSEEVVNGNWKICSPSNVPGFSAAAYFFARELYKNLGVPVGILQASVGGTAILKWFPKSIVDLHPEYVTNDVLETPDRPSVHYNKMINPLAPFAMKGVVWYQGEYNAIWKDYLYKEELSNMIASWRYAWDQGDFPFIIVQIPFYNRDFGFNYPIVRSAEYDVSQSVENTGLVVTYDTNDGSDLHPIEKQEVGRRISLTARKIAYQQDVLSSGPLFKTASVGHNKIVLTFAEAGKGLLKADSLKGFKVQCGPYLASVDAIGEVTGPDQVTLSGNFSGIPLSLKYIVEPVEEPPYLYNTSDEGSAALPAPTFECPFPALPELELTFTIKTLLTKKFVSTGTSPELAITATGATETVSEQFVFISQGNNQYAIKSKSGNQYLTLMPDNSLATTSETYTEGLTSFEVLDVGGGYVTLRSKSNGLLVSVSSDSSARLVANKSVAGNSEKFQLTDTTVPVSVGGKISGGTAVSIEKNTTTLTLSGHSGNVLFWESTSNNWSSITHISNTTISLTVSNLVPVTKYRAIVQNGANRLAYSLEATISPTLAPIGALTRKGWTATASVNNTSSGNGIDGNASSRWDTQTSQVSGQWYMVDMKTTSLINKVFLEVAGSFSDSPAAYKLYVSEDGLNWGSAIASGTGTDGYTVISFKEINARYIKIEQTGTKGNYWSLHEFYALYVKPGEVLSAPEINNGKDEGSIKSFNFNVFPIPAFSGSKIFIHSKVGYNFTTKLFNLQGRLLNSIEVQARQGIVDYQLGNLNPGVYCLMIEANNFTETKKLIIK